MSEAAIAKAVDTALQPPRPNRGKEAKSATPNVPPVKPPTVQQSSVGKVSTSEAFAHAGANPEQADLSHAPDPERLHPSDGWLNEPLAVATDESRFKTLFVNRTFCPVMYMDLDNLKCTAGIDLSPYFGHYDKLLQINMPYSPKVVRHFYSNMELGAIVTGGKVRSYFLDTSVRGKKISLSPELINVYLQTEGSSGHEVKALTPEEIYHVLTGRKDFPGNLRLKPTELPDHMRIIHYVYSRCMVNKGGNFSHLNDYDYPVLASIATSEKRDIGAMVFEEMKKAFQSKSTNTQLPYPQLVSFILSIHNIWYLEEGDEVCKIPPFDKASIQRLHIPLHGAAACASSAKGKGKAKEDASSPRTEATPSPSFATAAIKHMFREELDQYEARLDGIRGPVLKAFDRNFEDIGTYFEELTARVDRMGESFVQRMDRIDLMLKELCTHVKAFTTSGGTQHEQQPTDPTVPFSHEDSPEGVNVIEVPEESPARDSPVLHVSEEVLESQDIPESAQAQTSDPTRANVLEDLAEAVLAVAPVPSPEVNPHSPFELPDDAEPVTPRAIVLYTPPSVPPLAPTRPQRQSPSPSEKEN